MNRSMLFRIIFFAVFCFFMAANAHAVNVDNYNDFLNAVTTAPSGVTTEIIISTPVITSTSTSNFGPSSSASLLDIKSGTGDIAFLDSLPIFIANGASINFTDIGFKNSALSLYATTNSNISFKGNIAFLDNNSISNPGAIYAYSAQVAFDTAIVNFANNTGHNAGAIESENNSNITFNNSTVSFSSNSALGYGGAIEVYNAASVNFNNSFVDFSSNTAGSRGGAVAVGGQSEFNLTNSTAIFSFNKAVSAATTSGGALFVYNISRLNFTSSKAIFSENSSQTGGAFFLTSDSEANFINSDISFDGNSATESGGAIQTYLSKINFTDSIISFTGNKATTTSGGAMHIRESETNITGSTVTFYNNQAKSNAGAVYFYNESTATFTDSTILITSNSAQRGGGMMVHTSYAQFNGGNASFSGNTASLIGGALDVYSNDASQNHGITFNSAKVNFTENAAVTSSTSGFSDGGAININSSKVVFNDSEVNFTKNKAGRSGAAIAVYGSGGGNTGTLLFNNSTVNFTGNEIGGGGTFEDFVFGGAIASITGGRTTFSSSSVRFEENKAFGKSYGGAIYANVGDSVLFGDSDVLFLNNLADGKGGAVGLVDGTTATFKNTSAVFSGNKATDGGAVYVSAFNFIAGAMKGRSYLEFDETSAVNFSGNIASGNGGAVFLDGSSAVFAGTSTFANNISSSAGGAFYLENGSSLEFTDTASVLFSANNANKGGALYLSGNSDAKISNAVFSGNTASSLGGAIYTGGTSATQRAVLEVGASSGITTTFTGNTANGVSNAIYVDNHSDIIFNISAGGIVDMSDNITANSANDSKIFYKGAGDFNLNAFADTEYVDYELDENVKFNLGLNGQLKAKDFEMKGNSVLNMKNDSADTLNVSSFDMSAGNTLNMDIINNTPANDTIMAQNAVNLDGTLNLYIGVGDYTNLHIYLINSATDQLNGAFSAINLISLSGNLIPEAGRWHEDYDMDWFKIVTYLRNPSNFANLRPLSHNQKEVAKSIDKISGSLNPYGEMAVLVNNMLSSSVANQKSALSQMAGDFIANAMLSGVSREHRDTLSVRMNPRYCPQDDTKLSKSIWGQAKGRLETLKETENSIGDFHNNVWGIQAGVDVYSSDKVITGLFIGYNDHSLEQGNSEGDIDKYEFGAYSGFSGEHWELSGILSLGYGQFDTRRKIEFANRTAKAEFNGYSIAADIEAGYKINLSETINLKPFAGLTFGLGITESFKEKEASVLNLHVDEATQIKTDVLFGLSLEREKQRFTWNAGIYGKYVVTGEKGIFDAVMEGTKEKMEIWGAEQGRISANIMAGLEYALTKKWSLYANANAGIAEDYENYQGIAGVNYKFCGKKKDQKSAKQQDEVTEVKEEILTAAEEEQLENEAKEKAEAEEERLKKENEEKAAAEKAAEEAEAAKAFASKKEVEVAKLEVGKIINVSGANFLVGKATVGPKTRESIKDSAQELKDKEFEKIIVTGHTDSTGSKALNDKLSLKRAEAVADILTDNGIAREKISTIGKGSSEPIATNATPEGRAENRRVEIEVK